jgi:hypothetical protein
MAPSVDTAGTQSWGGGLGGCGLKSRVGSFTRECKDQPDENYRLSHGTGQAPGTALTGNCC